MEEGAGHQREAANEDRVSFEDSERFEEDDSICTFSSESASLNYKWRPGIRPVHHDGVQLLPTTSSGCNQAAANEIDSAAEGGSLGINAVSNASSVGTRIIPTARFTTVKSLAELCAREAARSMSSELLESTYRELRGGEHLPDSLFIPILKHCFPESAEDIRLYSCLASGNANQYIEGEHLYRVNAVGPLLQIGYHLSGTVSVYDDIIALSESNYRNYLLDSNAVAARLPYDVSIRVDRCRVVHCSCSCADSTSWCAHTVAVCLKRIRDADHVEFRPQIWDSIASLDERRLKKFAQYLINELQKEYLPVAQKLIDSLNDAKSEINSSTGVPDPTAGGLQADSVMWCMDEPTLQSNIQKILVNFVRPSPTVHCDVQYLSCNSPASSNEWNTLIRPHLSSEPEALWNLLSIVKEMFKRRDENAASLLHLITVNCIGVDQLLLWWYLTQLTHSGYWHACNFKNSASLHSHALTTQYHTNSLFEEIVRLWRLVALNPRLSSSERVQLSALLRFYHSTVVQRIWTVFEGGRLETFLAQSVVDLKGTPLCARNATFAAHCFPGFLSALRVANTAWEERSEFRRTAVRLGVGAATGRLRVSDEEAFRNLPFLKEGAESLSVEMAELTTSFGVLDRSASTTKKFPSNRKSRDRKHRRRGRKGSKPQLEAEMCRGQVGTWLRDEENDGCDGDGDAGKGRMMLGEENESNADSAAEELPDAQDRDRRQAGEINGHCSRRRESWNEEVDALFALAHEELPPLDDRFQLCVALRVHGYAKEAFKLAANELASELLTEPNRSTENKNISQSSGSKTIACREFHEIGGNKAATTLARTIFLTKVLSGAESGPKRETNVKPIVIGLALKILAAPRGPATTRHQEVHIHHMENELLKLLGKIAVEKEEMRLVTEAACQYLESETSHADETHVPAVTMARYMLYAVSASSSSSSIESEQQQPLQRTHEDAQMMAMNHDQLMFEVALRALGTPTHISEREHPITCESIRRQRGELAMTLLLRYKDSPMHLGGILDKILDRKVHSMYSDGSSNAVFFCSTQRQQVQQSRRLAAEKHGEPSSIEDNFKTRNAAEDEEEMRKEAKGVSRASTAPPTEAQIHFMVEFAKRLRDGIGGNHSTSIFHPVPNHPHLHALNLHAGTVHPHRNLHMCSFLIGLYALGMNNIVFPNWATRTYSTHVSWIQTQALEIGRPALEILRRVWEVHFTPTEAASIADKASQSPEPGVVQEAARLALSVLSRAGALTPAECQKALNQCKEQNVQMLTDACYMVERAALSNPVHPDILFKVARHWFELHVEERQQAQQNGQHSFVGLPPVSGSHGNYYFGIQAESHAVVPPPTPAHQPPINYFNVIPPPPFHMAPPPPNLNHQFSMGNASAQNGSHQRPLPPLSQLGRLHVSYSAPNLQPDDGSTGVVPNSNFVIHHTHHQLPQPPTPNVFQAPLHHGLPPPPFAVGPPYHHMTTAPPSLPPPSHVVHPVPSFGYQQVRMNLGNNGPPTPVHLPPPVPSRAPAVYQPAPSVGGNEIAADNTHLESAHRMGMLALDAIGDRISQAEGSRSMKMHYSKNPSYLADVQWLLEEVSLGLGASHVDVFLEKASTCIVSPFLLMHLVRETISRLPQFQRPAYNANDNRPCSSFSSSNQYQSIGARPSANAIQQPPLCRQSSDGGECVQGNLAAAQARSIVQQNGHHKSMTELVGQCVKSCYLAARDKMNHGRLNDAGIEDMAELVLLARDVFLLVSYSGRAMFDAFVYFVRSQKGCKKEVLQRLNAIQRDRSAFFH